MKQYSIITTLFDDVDYWIVYVLFLPFVWCPRMSINVSVQYNGGLLPDIKLLTQCYHIRGTRLNAIKRFCLCNLTPPKLNAMKRFCLCNLCPHLNVLTFSAMTAGCSEGLDAFRLLDV